jgi:4-amino-4-deoxy-L-arabinose transferase-like glycosyltransferase
MENLKSWFKQHFANSPETRQCVYVWLIAVSTAVLHLAVAGRYGIFRNELYFIVCGRRPAFGYVDQPPLVPLLAAATQLFGVHVWLLRLPAIAAAVALVPLSAAFARLFSRRTSAIVAAALAAAIAPALAALTATLTTATFEPLAWTACAYFLARWVKLNENRALLWAGLVAGISMEAKYGIAMWLIGLAVGLLATPARRIFAQKSFWLALAIAFAIGAPSLIWQALHGWPFLALIAHHHATGTNLTGSPLVFEIDQAIHMNLLLAPLWLAGVIAPFLIEELRPFRFLSVAFVVTTAVNILTGGKNYYLFAVYPTMFAVGVVILEKFKSWMVAAWLTAATVFFAIAVPLALPVLDPPALARYMARTHIKPRPEETAAIGAPLTQMFSDELGWKELEAQVSSVYHSLPAGEQKKAAILAPVYGDAAAIDFYGRADGLPPVISGANQYYLWGTRGYDGSIVILVNERRSRWRRFCEDLQDAGTFGVQYAMPYERDRPIFLCRGLRFDLNKAWPRFRRYE